VRIKVLRRSETGFREDQVMLTHGMGRVMYALSTVFLGIIGLIWRDFAGVWQPIDNQGVDFNRAVVASLYAVAFLVSAIAPIIPRTARTGLPFLVLLHLLAAFGWIPEWLRRARSMDFSRCCGLAAPSHSRWLRPRG
jgi:hypothetical protein